MATKLKKFMMSSTVYTNECRELLSDLAECLSYEKLCFLAKSHALVQRKRVFDLETKMQCIFAYASGKLSTYSDIAGFIKNKTNRSISPQAISKTFDENSANFARELAQSVLKSIIQQQPNSIFNSLFSSILIQDSTVFQLPKELAMHYKGYAGDDTGSAAKIQYGFDLLSGGIKLMQLTDCKISDAQYACPENIEPNALYIRDLGYWNSQAYEKIAKSNAFFISRLCSNINVYKGYEKNAQKVDIVQVINAFLNDPTQGDSQEFQFFLGSNRLSVRFIIYRMPEGTAEKRAKRRSKKHGKKALSLRQEALNKVNVLVTNIPAKQADADWISMAYRLRWSVEMIFKTWKSCFELSKMSQQMSVHRFDTLFWLRMVHILISTCLSNIAVAQSRKMVQQELQQQTRKPKKAIKNCYFLSFCKCMRTIHSFFKRDKNSLIDFFRRSQKAQMLGIKKLFEELKVTASIRGISKKKNAIERYLCELHNLPKTA